MLKTKTGQEGENTLGGLCLLCVCDPEGHGVRPCRA